MEYNTDRSMEGDSTSAMSQFRQTVLVCGGERCTDAGSKEVLAALERLVQRIAVELGAAPAARVRLGLEEVKRRTLQNDLDERLGFNPRRTSA